MVVLSGTNSSCHPLVDGGLKLLADRGNDRRDRLGNCLAHLCGDQVSNFVLGHSRSCRWRHSTEAELYDLGYPRDAPATVLFGEWFRFGKPSDQQFLFKRTGTEQAVNLKAIFNLLAFQNQRPPTSFGHFIEHLPCILYVPSQVPNNNTIQAQEG
ncbi:hypothetical protein LXL04_023442 [Taraxacum kok-saghyz]